MATTWEISVDWNNDGDFSDSGENITAYVISAEWRNGFDQPYMSVGDENTAELVLKNDDKRFSPEYSSGPYYGSLLPHRKVRVRVTTAATTTMFVGWIESIHPTALPNGEQVAVLRAHGAKRYCDEATVYLPLMENARSDEVIVKILEQVALPPAQGQVWLLGATGFSELGSTTIPAELDASLIETGQATFPYVGDTFDQGMTATEAIYAVVSAERGRFFYNRDGRAVFWDRHYLQLNVTGWGTFTDVFINVDYGYGEDMANVVEVTVRPRALSANDDDILWTLDEPVSLSPGEERTIRAQFKSDEDAQISGRNVKVPQPGSDFIADAFINIVGFTASANSAEITVRNDAGSDGDVDEMRVRGQKLTSFRPQTLTAMDPTSVALYGRRTLTIDAGMMSDSNYAQDLADYMLSRRKDPRGVIRKATLANKNDTLTTQMRQRTIGQRIQVVETQTAHAAEYTIVGERHELSEGLKLWLCEWTLEPAAPSNTWLLGATGRSELGTTTIPGF